MESFSEFKKKRIKKFLKETSEKLKADPNLSQSKIENIFKKSLELLSLPQPNKEIFEYFCTPEILDIFLNRLCLVLPKAERESFQNLFAHNNYLKRRKESVIKFRILGEHGFYPDCELERGDSKYTIFNSIPVLITMDDKGTEDSEIAIPINRSELRVATCAMITQSPGCNFVFNNGYNGYNVLYISKNDLKKVPRGLQLYFLHQLLQYENLLKYCFDSVKEDEVMPHEDISIDPKKYAFLPFESYIEIYNKLFDSFDINNQLLLKTSYYFLKASMLRFNLTFQEEATANVFFCLEGCLHLLQKKYGVKGTRLNLKKLHSIFKKYLPNGEGLFDFIEYGYYKRNELVHAETDDWGAEWPVPLMADDLYEYFDVCVELLNLILIERKIAIEKEQEWEKLKQEFKDEEL